jgi:hypothetical protein
VDTYCNRDTHVPPQQPVDSMPETVKKPGARAGLSKAISAKWLRFAVKNATTQTRLVPRQGSQLSETSVVEAAISSGSDPA